ncbi:SPOR domain-containing protein [Prevotella ihumii]|uniref:SPOR domain-containing protein n=1 Tax=Prevotella ihumii TaxID=1917878 RepID=UPI000981B131|nr:SPOR domain-containing protein [Prevotella ihumii]
MKKFLTTLIIALIGTLAVCAQGTVTVTQSADIDALVNGKKKAAKKPNKEDNKKNNTPQAPNTKKIQAPKADIKTVPTPRIESPTINSNTTSSSTQRTKLVRRRVRKQVIDPIDGTETKHTVTKRVLKGVKKVRGFRVLAYSGGNTRIARQEAERMGQKAKQILPDQPIYVHFYSPRWMCQVGNFTNYNEARKVIKKLKKEGFTHANIIRTMVTIQTTEVVGEPTLAPEIEDYTY